MQKHPEEQQDNIQASKNGLDNSSAPKLQQSNHSNTSNNTSESAPINKKKWNIIIKEIKWQLLCINLFIPSIFVMEIYREVPNLLKIIANTKSNFIASSVKSSQAPSRKTTGMSSAIQKRTSEGIIKTKAEKIAVKVVFSEKSSSFSGSGIIIKKIVQTVKLDNQQRYKYYVLTNKHVSKDLPQNNLSSKIITHEKKEYIGKSFEILKSLLKYDLQLITFESNQEYEVASISNSVEISQWDRVYIFGYPCDEKTCNVRKFIPGNIGITTLLPNSLKLNRGYSIPYTNETEPGMSGSPVLNYNAEVIAIHGLGKNAETDSSQQKDSPYLLSNESQLSSEKKEIANFFSWGIDMTRIKEELLNSLQ